MEDRHETQWLFSAGELEQTPSVKLGMSVQNERILRQKCILFILELARYLSCNHLVVSSASIMFHRFMMCQAFQNHDRFIVCATCIFLAGKVEEQPKRLKDVVDVFLLIRSKVQNKFVEAELKLVQDKLLVTERILLQTLGFDLQIDHPYGFCMHLLKSHKASFTCELARGETNEETRKELNEEARKDIKKLAMNFLTDSFRGVLCLEFSAEVVATAVTLLAVLSRDIPVPSPANRGGVFRRGPGDVKTTTWTELLLSTSKGNVSEFALKTCCSRVVEIYEDKLIAIAGTGSEDSAVKENNLLRMKLDNETKTHAAWLTYPVADPEAVPVLELSAPPAAVVALPASRPPPPPPPRTGAPRPLNRSAPPPPPPARPLQHRGPPLGGLMAPKTLPPSGQGSAPPTPDVLPPPTPDYIPPPTPETMPPPTPEYLPPPTPVNEDQVHTSFRDTNELCNKELSSGEADSGERARKRRADDRVFGGNTTDDNVCNGVRKDDENGNIINGRNDDGSSPPKKHKV